MEIWLKPRTSDTPSFVSASVLIHGRTIRLSLDINSPTQRFLFECIQAGILAEPISILALDRFLRPGDTFIDIGAHVGYFSLIAAAMVGESGLVVSIEPEETNFNNLRRNLALNPFSNVLPVHAAVCERNGFVSLHLNKDNDGGHSLSATVAGNDKAKEVPCVTLDSLVASLRISSLKAVKMDVEGAETKVVRGGSKILGFGRVGCVICEFNLKALELQNSSAAELIRLMYSNQYRGFTSENGRDFCEITVDSRFDLTGNWSDHFRRVIDNLFFLPSSIGT